MAAALNELKQKVLDAKAALNAATDARDAAKASIGELLEKQVKGSLTDAEKAALATAETTAKAEDGKVSAARKLVANLEEQQLAAEQRNEREKADAAANPKVKVGAPNAEKDPVKGFRDHRDYFSAVKRSASGAVKDERLKMLAVAPAGDEEDGDVNVFMLPIAFTPAALRGSSTYRAAAGADEQGVYDDRYGGIAVARTQLPGLLQLGMEGDPTAGRTQAVPMATPIVDMIARTDKNHTSSVTGGFTVTRSPETVAKSSTRAQLEMVSLKATSLFGLAYVTEEQISDSFISIVAVIEAGFRDQFAHQILNEKLRGGGGNEYLGVLTALSASSLGPTISIAKESGQAADTFLYNNVVKMRSRCWGFANAIWIANHDCYPQLSVLSVPIGVAGALVYQTSTVPDRPDTLLGRPIFYTEYASTVGDQGDLILGNWSQFLEGTYQPLQSAESIHVRFVNHERTFKFWLRNAGAPWWRSALTPFKGANGLSPFVVLDAR